MHNYSKQKLRLLRANASAMGGYIEEPFRAIVPTLAPASLSAVGGFATAQAQAYTVENILSCASCYTRVSGRQNSVDGSLEILMTSVVERLNILDMVRAERLTAQVAIAMPAERGQMMISVAGSTFEGLRLMGRDTVVKPNAALQQAGSSEQGAPARGLGVADFRAVGRAQALNLLSSFESYGPDAHEWVSRRYGSMTSEAPSGSGNVLCSLVDGVEVTGLTHSAGHIVQIPQFGRLVLGEVIVARTRIQMVALRAELGCPFTGHFTAADVGGGGADDDDP
jgi:hypothetical protein